MEGQICREDRVQKNKRTTKEENIQYFVHTFVSILCNLTVQVSQLE